MSRYQFWADWWFSCVSRTERERVKDRSWGKERDTRVAFPVSWIHCTCVYYDGFGGNRMRRRGGNGVCGNLLRSLFTRRAEKWERNCNPGNQTVIIFFISLRPFDSPLGSIACKRETVHSRVYPLVTVVQFFSFYLQLRHFFWRNKNIVTPVSSRCE